MPVCKYLAHIAGWEQQHRHGLGHVSRLGFCTVQIFLDMYYHNDRLRSTVIEDLDHGLSDV